MSTNFDQVEKDALEALGAAADSAALETWRVACLGRSAPLMAALGTLGTLPKEERRAFGQRGNEVKQALERAFEEASERIRQAELASALVAGTIDVTAPGRRRGRGRLHPATQTLRRIYAIFAEMGFQIYRSREVETDELNFG
jgi:phenylalanyl-tRNA synthetase alpha chain